MKVHAILDEKGVDWISTDVLRIPYIEKPCGDVILWIGVKPGSLSCELGVEMVLRCKELLDYSIKDIDVEIRQSEVVSLAGPQLREPDSAFDPMDSLREPLTYTLGIPICSQSTPRALVASFSTTVVMAGGFS